jgi:uncharacterized protein (DUF1330 family)
MPAYAIGHLQDVRIGPAIVEYLQRIDATLAPFCGRFLIHGARAETIEGSWSCDLVVIEFPDLQCARNWYSSPAYQAILRLRTDHAQSDVVLLDGVAYGHRATDVLAA